MKIAIELLQELEQLPEEKQEAVLDFARFLVSQYQGRPDPKKTQAIPISKYMHKPEPIFPEESRFERRRKNQLIPRRPLRTPAFIDNELSSLMEDPQKPIFLTATQDERSQITEKDIEEAERELFMFPGFDNKGE